MLPCEIEFVEFPIYGLGREGLVRANIIDLDAAPPTTKYTRELGQKYYELSDHLGNPRVIITDRLLSDVVNGTPGKYRSDIVSYSNQYPYGMEQPGRYMNGSGYRYGYNGMERDSAVTGGHHTTYFRQYDARLGRFWSTDPLTHSWESPYVAMSGNPVALIDPSGAEGSNPLDPPNAKPTGGEWQSRGQRDNTSVADPPLAPCFSCGDVPESRAEGTFRYNPDDGRAENWHNEVDGTGYWQQNGVYHRMVEGLVDRLLMYPFTRYEEWGWRTDVEYALGFYDALEGVKASWATAGPNVNGHWNPYFKGHGLISNDMDVVAIGSGVYGLGRLGIGALRFAGSVLLGSRVGVLAGRGIGAVGDEAVVLARQQVVTAERVAAAEVSAITQPSVAPNLGRKLEYFLGNAGGNAHNIERSRGMLRQLQSIGLHDTPAVRRSLTEHLSKVLNDPSNIVRVEASGRTVRESLLMGPNGGLKFETIWDGTKLITGKFLGGR